MRRVVALIWLWLATSVAAASVPDLDGARIGAVRIVINPIFDPQDRRENGTLYRTANRLHVETRESAVAAQLLFRSGDPYSPNLVSETERNLRKLPYLREPTIHALPNGDGTVDIVVEVRDVWTTSPGISFGRAGGANRSTIEFEDQNLLGFGKHASIGYRRDAQDTALLLRWHDPNVFGSRWTDDLQFEQRDRGQRWAVGFERPFYSLATPWAFGLHLSDDDKTVRRYQFGREIDQYLERRQEFDLQGGRTFGTMGRWSRRWLAGLRFDDSRFERADSTSTAPIPDQRRLRYPYFRLQWIEDDFAVDRNLDQIGRSEDLQFGRQFGLELGLAGKALGSDRDAALLRFDASRGFRLNGEQQLFLSGSGGLRLEQAGARDALLSLNARYYRRTSPRTTLYVGLGADAGRALDGDHLLALGGDNGLRGYPLQYQQGRARALLTVEERLFTNWYPFRLAHVGAGVFADIGRTWGPDALGAGSRGLLADVGVGLRFGNSRSALGSVLHVDLAMPLQRRDGIQSLQFLIQTKRSF